MLSTLAPIDKLSIVSLGKIIEQEAGTSTNKDLAMRLGVPLMSENRNRKNLLKKISVPPDESPRETIGAEPHYQKMIKTLLYRSGGIQTNAERASYPPWFKDMIIELREAGASVGWLSQVTGVSSDTLNKFKATCHIATKEPIDAKSKQIAEMWNEAAPYHRDNLDRFWEYLGKKHPSFEVSKETVRQTLINLGLRYPRGPHTCNKGTQVKREFKPHAVWEGDAKQIKVFINGQSYEYSWYAFVDQNTTLIVGSNIAPTESSQNFLDALKCGQYRQGSYPIGVLIDNRLQDKELNPIHEFCKSHNIVLVRTFPGNSKSNGNVENNFSLFERLVGPINLSGNQEEIAEQIATMIVEIFTGLRNHSPRQRLHNQTPHDVSRNQQRPEEVRSAIEKLRNRFQQENIDAEFCWKLIAEARKYFGEISEASELKIKRQLVKYPATDIIAAQAAYLAQIRKYPTQSYGSEYFMAILRNKRETLAKRTYNEAYRAGIELLLQHTITIHSSPERIASTLLDELLKVPDLSTPAEQLLQLEAISWWLVGYTAQNGPNSLRLLMRHLGDLSEITPALSLRWWQNINEYLYERIGSFINSPINLKNHTVCENARVSV